VQVQGTIDNSTRPGIIERIVRLAVFAKSGFLFRRLNEPVDNRAPRLKRLMLVGA